MKWSDAKAKLNEDPETKAAYEALKLGEQIVEILRNNALGSYTKSPEGHFVPLDWSGTPDSYFNEPVQAIIEAHRAEQLALIERIRRHWTPGLIPDGNSETGGSETEVVSLSVLDAIKTEIEGDIKK